MAAALKKISWIVQTCIGSAIFAMGFAFFLQPNEINTGGISGLAMILTELTGFGTVGTFSIMLNIPLFLIGGFRIGKRFFAGSLLGMTLSSVLIDVFACADFPATDPLLGGLYGGALCGIGLGIVFGTGASTGGSDIMARLLKLKWRDIPIGQLAFGVDALVVILTGVVFHDISKSMYSGVVIYISGQVMDAIIYRFDYSKVALIISDRSVEISRNISEKLKRGSTFLQGQGRYAGKDTKVVLSVVKKRQLAELKALVMEIDPSAFVIFLEAHQVLGNGFASYTKDTL